MKIVGSTPLMIFGVILIIVLVGTVLMGLVTALLMSLSLASSDARTQLAPLVEEWSEARHFAASGPACG